MNKAILYGNVGKDPEVKTFEGGKKKASFSLATTRSFKDKDGNRLTDWHRIVAWGSTADLIEKFIKKGSSLIVEGEIQYRKYTDKDGAEKDITEINCNQVHFTGKKESGESKTALDAASETERSRKEDIPADNSGNEDDLPF